MFFRYNFKGIVCAVLVLILSISPAGNVGKSHLEHLDKFVHLAMYAVLSYLWIVGLIKQHQVMKFRHHSITISVLSCVVFGVLMEILQGLLNTGRSFEWLDILANSSGTLVGVGAFYIIFGKQNFWRYYD